MLHLVISWIWTKTLKKSMISKSLISKKPHQANMLGTSAKTGLAVGASQEATQAAMGATLAAPTPTQDIKSSDFLASPT
jgi:hypothetical protein